MLFSQILTFAHVSLPDEAPELFWTIMAISWTVKGFLDETVAVLVSQVVIVLHRTGARHRGVSSATTATPAAASSAPASRRVVVIASTRFRAHRPPSEITSFLEIDSGTLLPCLEMHSFGEKKNRTHSFLRLSTPFWFLKNRKGRGGRGLSDNC